VSARREFRLCQTCGRECEADFSFCPDCGCSLASSPSFFALLEGSFSRIEDGESKARIDELEQKLDDLERELDEFAGRVEAARVLRR